jgi:hypothetical protein
MSGGFCEFRNWTANEGGIDWPGVDGQAHGHEFVESRLSLDGLESHRVAR